MATVERVYAHFANSEKRLTSNAEKAAVITREIGELETLAGRLREDAGAFKKGGQGKPNLPGKR